MTTIAFTGKTMAADTMISSERSAFAFANKIRKVRGYLIGACGDSAMCAAFLQRFDPKIIEEKRFVPVLPGERDDDFEALVISPKGKIYHLTQTGAFEQIKSYGYIALGSGADIATGAMYAGATAVEAVKAAMRHSFGTGGSITRIRLGK